MPTPRRTHHQRILAVLIAAALAILAPRSTMATLVDGDAAAILSKSREQYERAMDDIRRAISAQLESKKEQAKKLKDNTEATAEVLEEIKEFIATGAIPDTKSREKLEQAYRKAASQMKKAYNDALLSPDGERLFAADAAQFWSQWDLVPWGPDLVNSERTLASTDDTLVVDAESEGEYRVDVHGTCRGKGCVVLLDIPLADGRRLRLPSLPIDDGPVRLLLSVREDHVSADLGFARPVDLSTASNHETKGIEVSAANGAVVIESVRVKPIVAGSPPEPMDPAKRPADSRQPDNADPLPLNASGSGNLYNHNSQNPVNAQVTVIERDGSTVVLRVVRPGTGETFRVSCTLSRGNLAVNSVEQTQPPRGAPRFNISRTEGGNGTIRNGVLGLRWTVRGSSPPAKANNRPWTVTLKNVKIR
ncbi:MAG: hypothetical protein KF745_01720 [Phycisphaeraceae bacterium]|nr:hypothetical protein [Phycisphaeraceae bacterium]